MSPLHMDGAMIVENPYGNLPASQYGSLPFYTFMCFLYVISVIVWGMLCISYSKEVMSVQIIILIVIVSFVIDYSVKVLSLTVFNNTGNNSFILSLLSIAVDCTTRTLTRVLTLLVCMGLGVCHATVSGSMCSLVTFSVTYYLVSLWDAYSSLYPSDNNVIEYVRLFVTSG